MAQFRYVSGYNGYMPEATGLVCEFVRKESEFPLNRWVQYVPTPAKLAYYVLVEQDQQVRMYDDATMIWEDGASRKHMGKDNKLGYQDIPFRTIRRNRAWEIGWETIALTKDWKLKQSHMDACISQMMINRTKRCVDLIDTASNWGNNVGTANALNNGFGKWSTGSDDPKSPNYNAIFRTLLAASQAIHLATNGKVKPTDLRVVVSPGAAIKIATCPEMTNYCRESPYSKEILHQGQDPQYQRWGIPEKFKGFEFIVEDTMRVSQQANATATQATANRNYLKSDTSAAILARVGGIDGEYGTQNYSTVQLYHYGPLLSVEAFDDPEDHLIRGHVSEDTKEVLVTSLAGYDVQQII